MSQAIARIEVPAEPEMLVAVRVFVGTSARILGLDEPEVAALKQAASEVAAGLIEAGMARMWVEISSDEGGVLLRMPFQPGWWASGPVDRRSLVEALLEPGGSVTEDSAVTLRAPSLPS